MTKVDIVKLSRYKTPDQFRARSEALGIDLPFDDEVTVGDDAPLAQPITASGHRIGNRFCILPMEGWDGTDDGKPSDLVHRRWTRFGESGAKLIWGGEAVAVQHSGRANPHQLVSSDESTEALGELREALVDAHKTAHGNTDDLLVGLQLTHSGRFSRPEGEAAPRTAYRHPILDARVGITDDSPVFSDAELDALAEDFIKAGVRAQQAGFTFVDIKHCHGYCLHELLSGVERDGKYGGSFENRTRFLRTVVDGIRAAAPGLDFGVRLSIFDFIPFHPGDDRIGIPEASANGYPYAFGGDGTGLGIDYTEPSRFLALLEELGILLVCLTAGSPYYNPHIQRPAFFPPSDGYMPPEDPLVGVARQIHAGAELKRRHSNLTFVGAGYSYLQEWLPNVGQAVVRRGMANLIGIGRMALSYPHLPADVLAGRPIEKRYICRTFSDCTTAPRAGMISGCFPLDPFYKERPEHAQLKALKDGQSRRTV